ncbi:protein FAR-RED ELONGATED HYPOCOTYL 3-like [Olea europaea var. sylvestris]|uniref:protein FAR-RED ELONGATED HYPOCOTYL 3-like n=1 Tax=Olea europaea var. sylvestris TaxID=158386 RepID=UPI000C1D2DB1|nr:protein FAR-RED ELONGATED HYPOCOTYL 3-like [Olea europaea var. sylvestris]
MSCVEKDCRNYIEKVRRLRLGEGDATAIQTYFSKMQAQCSGFFFSMDLDDDSRLKNIFWADNYCRQAYKEFGDVVTFDITSLTNKGRWVPCFLKTSFWARMSTTQRSKSMNAFFDGCHLFVFRGIICRHTIAVMIHCDVTLLPERYIQRKWKKDVSRAHPKVAVNYDGLASTPEQLKYGNMCRAFEEVMDLTADDEGRARVIMEWIKLQR